MPLFLVDASIGKAAQDWLVEHGFDAKASWDRDPKMPDEDILVWACAEGRIVVTADKDFGELVYREKLPHAGVLLVRLTIASSENKRRAMDSVAAGGLDRLKDVFHVYQDGQLRVRV